MSLVPSPPCDVPMAFQVMKLILFGTKPTWPSQYAAITPLGCQLRAPAIRGAETVPVVVQGGFRGSALQTPPTSTSGKLLLGGIKVTNPEPPPHQLKPCNAPCCPCLSSAAITVLLVPSLTSARRIGRP